jgi:hypothetical protein
VYTTRHEGAPNEKDGLGFETLDSFNSIVLRRPKLKWTILKEQAQMDNFEGTTFKRKRRIRKNSIRTNDFAS